MSTTQQSPDKNKMAPVVPTPEAIEVDSPNPSSYANIIPQNEPFCNTESAGNAVNSGQSAAAAVEKSPPAGGGVNRGARRNRKGHKIPGMGSKVVRIAIKIYDEQLPYGRQYLVDQIRATNSKHIQIIAMWHNRDKVTDGIWEMAEVKDHCHLVIRLINTKHRITVKEILDGLGIVFRKGIDDQLWDEGGVEYIRTTYERAALYLTHQTEEAIAEGKEYYDVHEAISNLTVPEIEQVFDGYIRVSEKRKITEEEMAALDAEAFDIGYRFGDFEEWYNSLPFFVRSHCRMRTIKESHSRGIKAAFRERRPVNRLCIFIEGKPNTGKTWAAIHALDGKRVLAVTGGGTGKFDDLTAAHDGIVLDDYTSNNLLNMTDNYVCSAYRRGSNNPPWAGEYFIVTSNNKFGKWLEDCKLDVRKENGQPSEHFNAMKSRFYVCRVGHDWPKDETGKYIVDDRGSFLPMIKQLEVLTISDRGSREEQEERRDKFLEFKARFEEIINTYKPEFTMTDYSMIKVEKGDLM